MIFRTGSSAKHFQILFFVVLFFIIKSNAYAIDIPDSTNKKSFPAPGRAARFRRRHSLPRRHPRPRTAQRRRRAQGARAGQGRHAKLQPAAPARTSRHERTRDGVLLPRLSRHRRAGGQGGRLVQDCRV